MYQTPETPTVKLTDLIAPAFYPVHHSIKKQEFDEIWLLGGRGSTKSSFAALQIVKGIMSEPNIHGIAFRKTGRTIRDSIQQSFLWAIDHLKVSHLFDHISSPAEITYLITGQKIIMRGMDDPRKIKSSRPRSGYFKYLLFEEFDEFDGLEEIRSVRQSILRGGEKYVEFSLFNPPRNPKHWANVEASRKKPNRLVHNSSYLEVPKTWLGDKFFADAEDLKQNDPIAYAHEYLGQAVGLPEGIVFAGKYEVQDFETPPLEEIYQQRFFYGVDWGSVDPNVMIRCFIKDQILYIDYALFDKDYRLVGGNYKLVGDGVELDGLADLFDNVPQSRKWKIYADSARPETIAFMKKQGFNIQSVKKTARNDKPEDKGSKEGYVEDGIAYLKGAFKKIIIHTRCTNLVIEFDSYRYKQDVNTKEILPILLDSFNHGIDALRYALADYIKRKPSLFD